MDNHPYLWLTATAAVAGVSAWRALAVATQDGWNGLVALFLAALVASAAAFLAVIVRLLRATFKTVSEHTEEIGDAWGTRIVDFLLRLARRRNGNGSTGS